MALMTSQNQNPAISPLLRRRSKSLGLASAMNGGNTFAPAVQPPDLPENYSFPQLAGYEEGKRRVFGEQAGNAINSFGTGFEKRATDRRAALASSLADLGQQQFARANPFILEDLNSRGLFTSPSAVNQAQTDALKEIALKNQEKILGLETDDFNTAESLKQSGLSAQIQAEQDALDAGLDLRRGQLEAQRADAQSAEERALADRLAKEQRRAGINQSLIGLGGTVLGGAMMGGKDSLLSGLFSKGAATTAGTKGIGIGSTGGTFGSGSGLSLTGGGTAGGTLGGGGGAGGSGFGGSGLVNALPWVAAGAVARNAFEKDTIGGTWGKTSRLFDPYSGVSFNDTSGVLKHTEKNPEILLNPASNTLQRIGGPVGDVAKKLEEKIGTKAVVNSVKKIFCFHPDTPIAMAGGDSVPIHALALGDETKGGRVVSVRVAVVDPKDFYDYLGVLVTGMHAVLENGVWRRVKDAAYSKQSDGGNKVFSIVTEGHRIYSNGITFADETETDSYEDLTIEQSLSTLNAQEANKTLAEVE